MDAHQKYRALRQVIFYWLLAYTITWGLHFFLYYLVGGEKLNVNAPGINVLWTLSLFGPFLAALIILARTEGRPGLKAWFRSFVQWRFSFVWYLLLLFIFPLVALCSSWIAMSRGAAAPGQWIFVTPMDLLIILIGQVQVVLGEESGWRGFAQPRVQKLFGAGGAVLIMAVMHAVWHLTMQLLPGFPQNGYLFWGYLLVLIGYSSIWTLLYSRTQSTLAAMLFHAAFNIAAMIMKFPEGIFQYQVLLWVAVAVVVTFTLLPRPLFRNPFRPDQNAFSTELAITES